MAFIRGPRPFKSPTYQVGPKTSELKQFEVNEQLKAGVIESTYYEWAEPVLFALKKYGKLRICIDYWKLNQVSVKDNYPLTRMD